MKFKIAFFVIVVFCIVILSYSSAYSAMADSKSVKEVHEGATVACDVCHVKGNFKEVNSYGAAYNEAGKGADAVKAIDDQDSDGDGVSNADEINAGTNPGDAESK